MIHAISLGSPSEDTDIRHAVQVDTVGYRSHRQCLTLKTILDHDLRIIPRTHRSGIARVSRLICREAAIEE